VNPRSHCRVQFFDRRPCRAYKGEYVCCIVYQERGTRLYAFDQIEPNFKMTSFLRSTPWHELIRSRPLVAGLGLFTHYILNNGEWEHKSHLIASGWIVAFIITTTYEWIFDPQVISIFQAFQVSGTAAGIYMGTLLTSLLIYRAFFHRLKRVLIFR
jgi:hypothetical protein